MNTNKPLDENALLQFVDKMIEERQDSNINEGNREKVRDMLLHEVKEAVNLRLIQQLSSDSQQELDSMLERNCSDEELDTFFASKIPHVDTEVAAALLDFRTAYLSPLFLEQRNGVATSLSNNMPSSLPAAPVKED